ncbi:MAG: hypothetical protein ABFE07_21200 [Armatimonadia bacterium]
MTTLYQNAETLPDGAGVKLLGLDDYGNAVQVEGIDDLMAASETAVAAAATATIERIAAEMARGGAEAAKAAAEAAAAVVGVTPESFGAMGDGTTDDSTAFASLYNFYTSGAIRVMLKPGATYLVGSMYIRAGWTIVGYGAKIKRIDEVKSATSTAISSGTTSITVASAAGFRIGQSITVYNGSSFEPGPHRITNISGSTLTVVGGWQMAFPSGGTVITCGHLIAGAGATRAMVLGVEINDNKGGNTSLNKWQTHVAVEVYGSGTVVRDCKIYDCCSEGIIGGDGGRIIENDIRNCNGNAIHVAGTSEWSWVLCNKTYNTNLDNNTGHNDGAVSFSNTAGGVVAFNEFDTGRCGVGAVDSTYDSQTHIFKNVVKNMTLHPIEARVPAGENMKNLYIQLNHFENCGLFDVGYVGTAGAGSLSNVYINDNECINTRISLSNITHLRMNNNTVNISGDTTNVGFSHSGLKDAVIDNLTVIGGLNGVYYGGNNTDVQFNSPKMKNNYQRAINGLGGSVTNLQIVLEGTYATPTNWIGALLSNGDIILGGLIRADGGGTAGTKRALYLPNGGSGVRGGTVIDMVILSASLQYDIRADGGSQNNTVRNCGCTGTVSNGGSGTWDTYALVA